MWRTGLVDPQHVGSSRTRARTRVPCVGRRILNHCATREALHLHAEVAQDSWLSPQCHPESQREHRLQTRRLSNCGSRAQLLRGMWNLPGPGLEPVSPALAGGFLTTAPPGKPSHTSFYWLRTGTGRLPRARGPLLEGTKRHTLFAVGIVLPRLSLFSSTWCAGFSSCGTRAQELWRTDLVAPRHVGSSWSRARTHVSCIGRRILNHCATSEAPCCCFLAK
ncbi:hypothetical protein J1605_007055 [Eschrichtius robustus]|uniref:Uncharacterized protein n=1 Tax=Eschrichtius robustus TaxID=9764 RepID=A0AB34H1Y9_ESCRO|nr:hypothetical protein J1605_007055 [Eschrichtius robustus]